MTAVMGRLRNCVCGEKKESGKEVGGDGVVNESDESFSTRIGRAVLTANGKLREGVGRD